MRVDLSVPAVMGIINVTPDSFFAGSRTMEREQIERRVVEAVEAGATILDVGGYSSRPGAEEVSAEQEAERLHRALEVIRALYPEVVVSLDTFRGAVVREVVQAHGACMINDIRAGAGDLSAGVDSVEMVDEGVVPLIWQVAARYDLPYIAMHMRGTPKTMTQHTEYADLLGEVARYFEVCVGRLRAIGVGQVILDPGFGFSKTTEQNYALLQQMHTLQSFGCPILAGISRKSMIYKPLQITPADALVGTSALHWECLRQGATILRVHDVLEAVQVVKLYKLFQKQVG